MSEPGRPNRIPSPLCLAMAALFLFAPEARAQDGASPSASASDTVLVAPPTGATETDRTNVQAAFDAVRSGGVVQFAPGMYRLGAGVRLTVPDVTVLGHPSGTVLRGCDPEAFMVEASAIVEVVFGCTGLYVQTERQTIRRLTFEYTWHGMVVGPYPTTAEEAAAAGERMELLSIYPAGGHRIEGNTFRATPNGLRVLGTGEDLTVVRDNDFVDVFHAIGIYGAPLHFLDNRVTVANPEGVPFSRHPGSAIIVSPGHTDCSGHVVAGNRIVGYPDPIYVLVRRGETCRNVEIRDNVIHAARVVVPEAWGPYTPTEEDSTMVGTPITLMNRTEPVPGMPEADSEGVLEDVLVQGNRIVGAEGLGILVQGASRSRITGNTIVGIQRRDPFPGLTWDGRAQEWEDANGSGIWLSPGSDGNEIAGNTFEDIAGDAIVLEGDSNRVELRSADDTMRDLGQGNRVTVPQVSDSLALTGVTLIDGTGAPPRPGMTVLLVGDRIERVFSPDDGEVPASARVLVFDGHYLIPGLINSHFHIPMVGWERDAAPPALERMLHAGVTTIREMAGDLRLTAELVRAALIEDAPFPTIHSAVRMAGPTYYEARAGAQSWVGYEPGTAPWAQAVTAETDLPRAVAVAAATGATGIKLYADLDTDLVRRIVDEAHRQGLKTWAHGTVFPAGPMDLLRAGVDGLSHTCFLFWGLQPVVPARMADRPFGLGPADLESDAFRELLEEMAARGVVMDATARNASRNPGASAAGCTPEVLNAALAAMHAAGVPISTGTDSYIAEGEPDPTLFTEIEYLVDSGVLTPLEVITAATLNGARAIGIEDSHGSVEAGKVADLVVLSADPSEDIDGLRAIVAVIKNGTLFRRSAYDERIRGEP